MKIDVSRVVKGVLNPYYAPPESYRFIFDCSAGASLQPDIDNAETKRTTYFWPRSDDYCSDILNPGYVTFNDLEGVVKRVPLTPEPGKPPFQRIRKCCGNDKCRGCFLGDYKTCVLRVRASFADRSSKDKANYQLAAATCKYCEQISCQDTCMNGQYASDYADLDNVR